MLKQLLTFATVAAFAMSASAFDLSLEETSAGWGSSYDPATHTITFNDSWTGQGWGWWDEPANFNAYTDVIIEVEPTTISAQLVVQYKTDTEINETSGFCDPGTTVLKLALNPELKNAVQQIYIQCGANPGTLTIVSAKVVDNSGEAPDPVLWTGNYTASGWNAGATINKNQVKVGDVLNYHMTPGTSEGAQVIVKGADWANLLGTAKITNASIIDGVVEVVVTEQMLESCGGNFFLQGDGGITCTMIEVVGSMDVMDGFSVINFGSRVLPAEIFTKIPEDTKYISVVLSGYPEWLQLCNGSWVSLVESDQAVVKEEDGLVMYSFPVTDDIISQINAGSQVIINGDANVTYLGAVTSTEIPAIDEKYTVGLEDNTTPWWSAWSKGIAIEGNGTMHYEFYNYSNGEKFWNNWLLVLTNSGLTPNDGAEYSSDQELVVLRADNYGWGPLYEKTSLTNDYDWDTFGVDMMDAFVTLDIVRVGSVVKMTAIVETHTDKVYSYTANIEGVTSDLLGSFLTTEGGHLIINEESAKEESAIHDITNDLNADAVYYNINGIQVDPTQLSTGLYIVKQGPKTSKVIIR